MLKKSDPNLEVTTTLPVSGSDEADFLNELGTRIRKARALKGISRRELSEISGVSQRYLAKLEDGSGNISIALLVRVAAALDQPLETFIRGFGAAGSEAARLSTLLYRADAEQLAAISAILDSSGQHSNRLRRVALIGLRGAGKSTLGRLAASALGVPFIELNQEIERASGMPVTELMALYGQEGYRRLERQSLQKITAQTQAMVLAVAGGIVAEAETFDFLLQNTHTIWLKARPEEHMARVRNQGDTRPMAGIPAAMEELKSILVSREAQYARAQAAVDTSGSRVEESLAKLLGTIAERGFMQK
ncbi:MAG: helix-turn-helix transcriptional regulator [Hyphomicrobiales bacterium]|nr:helix-turn-helix transcriptional regulator [Hyphomicrobiales bacterium]MDE2113352.1 helix-turn-helix transcriptional regulator [Hyphomicrobiales bacterium]